MPRANLPPSSMLWHSSAQILRIGFVFFEMRVKFKFQLTFPYRIPNHPEYGVLTVYRLTVPWYFSPFVEQMSSKCLKKCWHFGDLWQILDLWKIFSLTESSATHLTSRDRTSPLSVKSFPLLLQSLKNSDYPNKALSNYNILRHHLKGIFERYFLEFTSLREDLIVFNAIARYVFRLEVAWGWVELYLAWYVGALVGQHWKLSVAQI